jgi:beta-lactamase regulating signal transducer with metallopeptidase domain
MNDLGMQIGWLAAQVALVALLAVLLAAWAGRREARAAVVVLSGTLVIFLGLSVVALCPLPEGCRWSPFPSGAASAASPPNSSDAAEEAAAPPEAGGVALSDLWAWWGSMSHRARQSPAWQSGWTLLLGLYLVGVGVASLRLAAGWLSVRSLRRHSRPVSDPELLELAESLRVATGCGCSVEVRECDEPGLAATVGWSKPVVLLPPEWRSWTNTELGAVLAHELAHVRHRDYLVALLSCLCQAIYFYHPLVHWLSARLRWQQEMSADAVAAPAVGGRSTYCQALARLALRSPARTPAGAMPWPAMSGGILVRRIQMLRGTEKHRPLGWGVRGVVVSLVAGAAVLLSTLGSPARPPGWPVAPAQLQPFELSYVAPNAKGFIGIRPAVFLAQPGMDKLSRLIDDKLQELKKLGVSWPAALKLENIEQIVADLHFSSAGTGEPRSRSLDFGASSVLIRMNQDFDWPAFYKTLAAQMKKIPDLDDDWKHMFEEVKEIREDGVTMYRVGAIPVLGPQTMYFYAPDRRTVVFSWGMMNEQARTREHGGEALRRLIRNVEAARQRHWGAGLKSVERAPFAVVLDNREAHYAKLFAKDMEKQDLEVIEKIRFAALGIELGESRPVRAVVEATSAEAAAELEKAADRYAKLAETLLQEHARKPAESIDADEKLMLKLGKELVQSRQLRRNGAHLEWLGYSTVRVRHLFDAKLVQSWE